MQPKIITLLLLVMVLSLSFCDMANADYSVLWYAMAKAKECPQCKGKPFGNDLFACFKTCDDQKKSLPEGTATT